VRTVAPIVPILAALITGTVSLTVGVLAYIFGRLQKEHEVRFSRLHERRAEVVAELYQLLHEISVGFEQWDGYLEAQRTRLRAGPTRGQRAVFSPHRHCGTYQ
jgi:hypothetical protein